MILRCSQLRVYPSALNPDTAQIFIFSTLIHSSEAFANTRPPTSPILEGIHLHFQCYILLCRDGLVVVHLEGIQKSNWFWYYVVGKKNMKQLKVD